jgi:hypoxanthine phosphoribosyltransferase
LSFTIEVQAHGPNMAGLQCFPRRVRIPCNATDWWLHEELPVYQGTDISETHSRDIARIVVPRAEIRDRVDQLADEITDMYLGDVLSADAELTILAVLTGSLVFLADLVRRLPLRIRIDTVSASSYPGTRTTPAELVLQMPPETDLKGRNVLVVDDILDTGATLGAIMDALVPHQPLSIASCVLLSKSYPGTSDRICPDFCGFAVGPEFVVGYGLDYNGLYRNLPDICVLRPEALAPSETSGSAGRTR